MAEANRYRPYTAANFRSRSHDTAHASDPADDSPLPDHPLISRENPQFVDQQDALSELLTHLRSAGKFAYDSEFIGELTYVPKLCLIQVATTQRVALIDTLGKLDLTPFWQLLCDETVEKIVHAGQQDIEPVFRNANSRAANIFDTQISAGFIGLAYPVALSKLVLQMIGVKLGKGLTFTHWDQRPLSAMQLRYAADDVRYLLAVRAAIGDELEKLEHTAWASQECQALCDPSQYGFNPQSHYLRIRGASSLPSRGQAILKELTIWRDKWARHHNVPARSFLRDEILLELARSPVKSVDKLTRVKGLPRPVEQDHGAELVDVTTAALQLPAEKLPTIRDFEPTPKQRFGADALWSAVQCLCAGRKIDPNLVSSRQEIGELYRTVSGSNDPGETRLLQGWRREAVGQTVLDLLAGKTCLELNWSDTLGIKPTLGPCSKPEC
jgi:ribonuclease D